MCDGEFVCVSVRERETLCRSIMIINLAFHTSIESKECMRWRERKREYVCVSVSVRLSILNKYSFANFVCLFVCLFYMSVACLPVFIKCSAPMDSLSFFLQNFMHFLSVAEMKVNKGHKV